MSTEFSALMITYMHTVLYYYMYSTVYKRMYVHEDLPKGEKNDCFNGQELPHRTEGPEQVSGGLVEVDEAVQSYPH